jgi:hypothetical protein
VPSTLHIESFGTLVIVFLFLCGLAIGYHFEVFL